MIGQIISHYKIVSKLGQGGMGVVYKAEDTRLKRLVALKFLPPELTCDHEAKDRFIHEAQAASALEHPNICNIHEINETGDGQLYIVMAYYKGQTLADRIAEETHGRASRAAARRTPAEAIPPSPPFSKGDLGSSIVKGESGGAVPPFKKGGLGGILPIDETIAIAIQIARGLQEAHEKGIVHRDIKPANIMMTEKGQVKIMDFGVAKIAGQIRLTKTGSTLGTAAYMSPEQIRGEEVDQRSDIFSLGVVLYELLTSHLPFQGEYEAAVSYAILNERPAPIRSLRPEIPSDLERIIDRCLEKDKTRRYRQAGEIIADLRAIKQDNRSHAAISTKSDKMRWIIAVLVMIGMAVVSFFLFHPGADPASAPSKSIAVLPFQNLSDSKEDEYFSDGITDDIIAQLSKISDLKVISRTSVMLYKETDKNIRQIGKELDVGAVLEGSVRHAGNQVRIVAQLIDARNEGHLWAETYDKEMTQVFAIQSDVAQQIAGALRTKLSPSVRERIEKKQTENTEAYQLYLKGRFHWNKRRLDDIKMAIEYFSQAIEKDPHYAMAYAGLASAYVIMPSYEIQSGEWYAEARITAEKALQIDSTLAEAYTVLGEIAQDRYYDWEGAERHFRRAIDLDPGYSTAHQWYSCTLNFQGRFDEALSEAERALEIDPLSLVMNMNLGDILFAMRQYDKALEQHKNTLALDQSFPWAHSGLASVYEIQGRFDESIVEYKKAKNLGGSIPFTLAPLGWIYAKAGRKADALQILDELLQMARQGMNVSYGIAFLYYRLGEKDKAFEWFEKSYQDREIWLQSLATDPLWDDLRTDPRCTVLLKRMGLRK